ncbi:hypothetical protein ACFO0N_11325 [Halobium salinum]|uniref:Uncharacterized protein n=1 Tax=Halobium salinum TaxID=1364940 RepID=A0ABD5PCN3_9EURY|nr:hypothetical protein [Halobium salinum]
MSDSTLDSASDPVPEPASDAASRRSLLVAGVLLAALGGALFWLWRKNAPLSRHYRRLKDRRA